MLYFSLVSVALKYLGSHFFFVIKFLVGKIRKRWLRKTVGDIGLGAMQSVKQYIDPNNIFGNNNLMMGHNLSDGATPAQEPSNVMLPSKL